MYRAFVVAVAVVVALGMGWFACVRAWRWLANLEEFTVYPGNLALEPIEWLDTEALMADVRSTDTTGLLSRGCSYFTPNLAAKVAAAYEQSPWVRRVTRVRRKFPNNLDISLSVRRPFAVARSRRWQVVVDSEGVVLSPAIYRFPKDGLERASITLLRAPRGAPKPGEQWQSEDLAAGLVMLRYIEHQPALKRLKLKAVEVRREGGWLRKERLCLVLTTEGGPDILWGLPPQAAGPGTAEVDTDTKVSALQGILRHYRRRLSNIEYIDVRNDLATLKEKRS